MDGCEFNIVGLGWKYLKLVIWPFPFPHQLPVWLSHVLCYPYSLLQRAVLCAARGWKQVVIVYLLPSSYLHQQRTVSFVGSCSVPKGKEVIRRRHKKLPTSRVGLLFPTQKELRSCFLVFCSPEFSCDSQGCQAMVWAITSANTVFLFYHIAAKNREVFPLKTPGFLFLQFFTVLKTETYPKSSICRHFLTLSLKRKKKKKVFLIRGKRIIWEFLIWFWLLT